ncbi:MAG: DUF1080 domain-containing protein [Armatimonadota bacterium]
MGNWVELFDGQSLAGWSAGESHEWGVVGGVRLAEGDPSRFQYEPGSGVLVNGERGITADIRTERDHGSCELELEYCVPEGSNSGVYFMGQYEIQILDSWGTPDTKLEFGTNGGIYARWVEETQTSYDGAAPRVNASRAPGEWQQLRAIFHAPRFDEDGNRVSPARFERVVLNGIVIHEEFECTGPTRGAWVEERDIPSGPLRLQGDHGPVAFRNVRMRELD